MKYVNVKRLQSKSQNSKAGKAKPAALFVALFLVVFIAFLAKDTVSSWFKPMSVIANVSASTLKETDGRTNILVLGSDKRSNDNRTGELTDTILVASIGKLDKDIVLISLPRDLWVKNSKGYSSKINAVYASEKTDEEGIKELRGVIEEVLDIPIHYHAMVTFDLFKETVDALGGIQLTVDNSFTDYQYPIEGRESDTCGRSQEEIEKLMDTAPNVLYPCRYEAVEFKSGSQTMNGETALKFVRSRKGTNNEGTDFARAKRQQKVIMAIKDKALSVQTLINPFKLKELYSAYANNVTTDVDFATVQSFYDLSQKISFDKITSIVLDDRSSAESGGLLYAPEDKSLYNGAYVLVPKTGDYSQIHAYVQKYLFGDK